MYQEICYGYLHGVQCDCCDMYYECFGNDNDDVYDLEESDYGLYEGYEEN